MWKKYLERATEFQSILSPYINCDYRLKYDLKKILLEKLFKWKVSLRSFNTTNYRNFNGWIYQPTSFDILVRRNQSIWRITTLSKWQVAMADEEDTELRHSAIIEFIGCFQLSGEPPQAMGHLSDGVALFEALSEM